MNKFTIYGWADMYWEVQNEFSFPVRSGDDFLTGFLYRKKGAVTLELKAQKKLSNFLIITAFTIFKRT